MGQYISSLSFWCLYCISSAAAAILIAGISSYWVTMRKEWSDEPPMAILLPIGVVIVAFVWPLALPMMLGYAIGNRHLNKIEERKELEKKQQEEAKRAEDILSKEMEKEAA